MCSSDLNRQGNLENELENSLAFNFSRRFVACHLAPKVLDGKNVDYLPIPGIKSMLGLVILACGDKCKTVATTTNPGYPTPKVWAQYLGKQVIEPEMNPENNFVFNPKDLDPRDTKLIMMNYPHNPSGAVVGARDLLAICGYCSKFGIRLFNDAAYAKQKYGSDSWCLADVASGFADLSWAEAFSASKSLGNGTGWRVGAMVGSPDFIGDIKTIKGNADSGFVAPMAYGALWALEHDNDGVQKITQLYQRRATLLCNVLQPAGMRLATEPRAGFFTLWQLPKRAFGREIKDAEDFNYAMIEGDGKTGVIGVHFHPYIRYAVAHEDVEAMADDIKAAFAKADVSY